MNTRIVDVRKINEKILESAYVYGDETAEKEVEQVFSEIAKAAMILKEGILLRLGQIKPAGM